MPSEMVGRVAMIIEGALVDFTKGKTDTQATARAVLEALREPTEEMADVAWEHLDWGPPGYEDAASGAASPEKAWSIMLDTALKDTSE